MALLKQQNQLSLLSYHYLFFIWLPIYNERRYGAIRFIFNVFLISDSFKLSFLKTDALFIRRSILPNFEMQFLVKFSIFSTLFKSNLIFLNLLLGFF